MSIKDITIKIIPLLKEAGVTKSEIFVSYDSLNKRIKPYVEKDAIQIL